MKELTASNSGAIVSQMPRTPARLEHNFVAGIGCARQAQIGLRLLF